jgi:hypothetical protein
VVVLVQGMKGPSLKNGTPLQKQCHAYKNSRVGCIEFHRDWHEMGSGQYKPSLQLEGFA